MFDILLPPVYNYNILAKTHAQAVLSIEKTRTCCRTRLRILRSLTIENDNLLQHLKQNYFFGFHLGCQPVSFPDQPKWASLTFQFQLVYNLDLILQ